MEEILWIELGCLCVFIVWFIQHHSNKDVSLYVKATVFVDWLLSFGMILLLPMDVYLRIKSEQTGITQEDMAEFETLKIAHGIAFWSVMALCWVVIPFMEDYQTSGYLDHERKWQYALKKM